MPSLRKISTRMSLIFFGIAGIVAITVFSTGAIDTAASRECSAVTHDVDGPPVILPPIANMSTVALPLRLNGVRYAVPANYFRYPAIGCDTEEDGMLLRATYPGLQGATEETREWFDGGLNKQTLQILVSLQKNRTKLEGFLSMFEYQHGPPNLTETITKEFGMTHVRRTADRVYHKWDGDAFYRTNEIGAITDFIRCDRRRTGEISTCKIIVLLDHAQVQITFFPEYLPKWEAIQRAGLGLLESFRTQ